MTLNELQDDAYAAGQRLTTMVARFDAARSREGRDEYRPGEKQALDAALLEANGAKARLAAKRNDGQSSAAIERLTGPMTRGNSYAANGPGAQFMATDAGQDLLSIRGHIPESGFTTRSSELPFQAATLTGDSASGGALLIPDYQVGIVPTATRPVTVAALLTQGTTEANAVSYMKELAYTNAADTVAEGAAKPESTLTFVAVSDPVRKVAHWIPIVEEMLEDVPSLQSYLDVRLRLGVELALDDQLINGSVVAPDIVGFLARTGLATAVARGADVNADCILKQLIAIWTTTGLQPDGIVMNPANWQTILLTKDTTGQYYGGGPFSSPHAPTLWGVPVAISQVIAANTCLVGAFKTGSVLYRRGGLRVESSNSHASYFTENKLAVRAELRAALAVMRPGAFGICTGLV